MHRLPIIATVEDGSVVRIDGDPENPHNMGKACAKGRAGFFTLDSRSAMTSEEREAVRLMNRASASDLFSFFPSS